MPNDQFICFLEPTRAQMPDNPTPDESAAVSAHFAYYQGLHAQRTLILAGRTKEPPHVGIMIFEANDKAHAHAIVDADPAITAGVFTARIQPYSVALIAMKTPQWAPGIQQSKKETDGLRSLIRISLLFLWLITLTQAAYSLFVLCMSIFAWESFWRRGIRSNDIINIVSSVVWIALTIVIAVLWIKSRSTNPRPTKTRIVVSFSLVLFFSAAITLAWMISMLARM